MTEEMKREQANVRSFRVTDDVMEKFKEIQGEMALTQDGALKMLVEAYEFEKAKNMIPDRETEIANFQTKASELVEAFLHSLQLNQDAEARIRAEVALQLKSKDETIMELQERVKAKEELAVASNTAAMEYENRAKTAEALTKEAQEKVKAAEEKAKDKENINSMLTGKLAEAEAKLEQYPELEKRNAQLDGDLADALRIIQSNQRDAEIDKERAVASVQKEMDKALAEKERVMNQEFAKRESELIKQISGLEKELSKAQAMAEQSQKQIEKVESKNDSLQEQVSELKVKVAELTAQNNYLEAQTKKKPDNK